MKLNLFLPILLILALAACSGAGTPTAIPTVNLGNNGGASTPAPKANAGGGVTASGVIVTDHLARMAFKLAGNVKLVQVKAGDQVQAGQVLAQLDDTSQQIQLQQANLALEELTSASALATAQQTLAQSQQDLYNAQVALNNVLTQQNNQGLIDNAHAGLVLAQNALKNAQDTYNDTPGDPTRDSGKAEAYQNLYSVQQSYNNALYLYNLYTGKSNPMQVDEAKAKVAVDQARVAEGQTLVAALSRATLPDHPSGAGYAALVQANLNLKMAQAALDATKLAAPFDGEVASVAVSSGDYISPGQVVVVISDASHMHIETSDLSERDVPQVKLGQAATVSIKALNKDVTGTVTAISPLSDTLGGDVVYKVSLSLPSLPAGALAGMSVDVQFHTTP